MQTMTLELPKLHKGQREVWNHPARFKVMACGRRWGKSRLGSLLCIAVASQEGRAWWVGPTYPVASVGWRMIRRIAVQIPGVQIRESERMIVMPGGGTVQVKSADNPDSLRGEGLNFVVIDECAFVKEDAWTDALRPALADRKGGALFISTPKGHNWFWRLWHSANGADWKAWRFTSYDNPFLDGKEIDAARSQLPERTFSQGVSSRVRRRCGRRFPQRDRLRNGKAYHVKAWRQGIHCRSRLGIVLRFYRIDDHRCQHKGACLYRPLQWR
jgi:hypothetical protein